MKVSAASDDGRLWLLGKAEEYEEKKPLGGGRGMKYGKDDELLLKSIENGGGRDTKEGRKKKTMVLSRKEENEI